MNLDTDLARLEIIAFELSSFGNTYSRERERERERALKKWSESRAAAPKELSCRTQGEFPDVLRRLFFRPLKRNEQI